MTGTINTKIKWLQKENLDEEGQYFFLVFVC